MTPDPLPGSNFQGGDGNQADEPGHHPPLIDWQFLADRVGHTADRPEGDDDHFSQGSKEYNPAGWTLTIGNLGSPGADLLDTYRAFERGANGDAFLYLAMTRRAAAGSWYFTYELNQLAPMREQTVGGVRLPVPCRKTGDLLVTFREQGNETSVHLEEWRTQPEDNLDRYGCANTGTLEDVTPGDGLTERDVQGAFNAPVGTAGSIHNYLPGHYPVGSRIDGGRFVEGAINLTRVLQLEGEPCSDRNFLSIWAHSRSSLEPTSDLKDYIAPAPFVISVCKKSPKLSTTQGAIIGGEHTTPATSVPLGTRIFDTAHLTGGNAPTGTITFRLYRPGDRRCSRRPIFHSTVSVEQATGLYGSGPFTPTRLGTYRWTATYSGDANNHGFGPTRCRIEPVVVTKAAPGIETEASGTTVLPGSIHDTAALTGGHNPTGHITFEVFGPNDPNCAPPAAHTFPPVAVDRGNGTYRSPDFTPTAAGTWRFVATYSGDRNNAGAGPTACDAPGEEVVVDSPTAPPLARPALTTTATASSPAGSSIQDTAHLSGGANPTGAITFYIYGPNDSTCTGAPAAPPSQVQVSGPGDHTSAPFTPTHPGTYRWIAHYSGDANHEPAATSCNESGETSVVAKATPAITTSATPATAPYGSALGDTATLTGGADPTGTIEFRLYGPDDDSCSRTPAFVVHQVVTGNGGYPSPTVTATLAGTYRWVATYSGDARNAGVSTRCGDPGESAVVQPPPPTRPAPEEPEQRPTHKPTPKPKPKPPKFTG